MYAGARGVTYLCGEGMLDWNFPVLYLAVNLIAAEAVKRRSTHAQKEWFMALAVVLVSGAVQYWTLAHLPLKDYRPYAEGESVIANRMTADELGLEGPEFDKEIRFHNPETGAETLVMQSRYMEEKLWESFESQCCFKAHFFTQSAHSRTLGILTHALMTATCIGP